MIHHRPTIPWCERCTGEPPATGNDPGELLVSEVVRRPADVEAEIAARSAQATPDFWGVTPTGVLPPLCVEIQPTAHCHRTCSFCSHIIRNRRGGALTTADVDGLLDELRELRVLRIAFSGGGEPLYWAAGSTVDALVRAATFADVTLTTSGDQLLDAATGELHPDAARVLQACSAMFVNVPAVNALSFAAQVRGPSGWEHASRMLRQFVALRRSDPDLYRCRVVGVVVLSAFNVSQVGEIDRVLFEHGVDAIYYKQWKDFEKRNVRKVKLADEALLEGLSVIPAADRSPDLARFIDDLRHPDEENHPCWVNRLSYDAIVDPDGEVYLCTPTVGRPEHSIGNLDDAPFAQLWASAGRAGRLRVLDGLSATGVCPSQCRHHPENARLDALVAGGASA